MLLELDGSAGKVKKAANIMYHVSVTWSHNHMLNETGTMPIPNGT